MRRGINISYKYVKKLNDIVKENLQKKNKIAKSERRYLIWMKMTAH